MRSVNTLLFIRILLAYGFLCACTSGNEMVKNKTDLDNPTMIDRYMGEVADQVGKNFVYKAASKAVLSQEAVVAFTIMPDGKITNIQFLKKSENTALDAAALKAIKSASPTKPFPEGIEKPFIVMGLRFSTQGVK